MCLTESWTQNAVIRHRVLVIRRQMIERYRKGKKGGTLKASGRKTKQRWENYLFQKPESVFWWHSDEFKPIILHSGSNVHFRERMWAAISSHTQGCSLLHIHTHSVGLRRYSECRKRMKSLLWRSPQIISGRSFCFPLKTLPLHPNIQRHLLSLQTTWEHVEHTKDTQLGKGRLERDITAVFKYLKG